MKTLLAAFLVAGTMSANAECIDYADAVPARAMTVCVAEQCESTTLEYTCSNVATSYSGYANGLRLVNTRDGHLALLSDTVVDPSALRCSIEGKVVDCFATP